jgi:gliding motility-associated-like protein
MFRYRILLTSAFLLECLISHAQFGQIELHGNDAVFDPNGDGYVSTTTAGFDANAGYTPDQFEFAMFGLPKVGDGDVIGDAAGPSCSNTDLTPDSQGYSAYAILKDGNLIFRFRVANNKQNVPGYSVLIDTDGLLGPSDPDYVEGSRNPGFEIDITLIRGPSAVSHGVRVYDIDGGNNNCSAILSYPITNNHQRAIGDIVSCNQYSYFYDFYVPFADLTSQFGITTATEIRFIALTNNNATCAMSGSISDIGGVDDEDYASLFDAMTALSENQCPTNLGNLSEGGGGFLEGVTEKPAFDTPIREGDDFITGTAEPTATVTIKLYQDASTSTPLDTKTSIADAEGLWSITFDDPLVGGMLLSAVAQLPGSCGSNTNNTDPDNEVVLVEVVVVPNYPPVLTASLINASFTEGDVALIIDPAMAVSYPPEADYPVGTTVMVDAQITISGNYVSGEDVLQFTNLPEITGVFDGGSGVLTLTSSEKVTLDNYAAALRSVKYFNGSQNPSTATRTIQFVIDDGYPGGVSNPVEVDIALVPVNDAPVTGGNNPNTVTYPSGGGTIQANQSITVSDVDNITFEKAEIRIINVLDGAFEELQFTDINGIINATSFSGGILTIEGTASITAYQTALREVVYVNTAAVVTQVARQLSFRVFDGLAWSNTYSNSYINFDGYNNPPVVLDKDGNSVTELFFEFDEDSAIEICLDIRDPESDLVVINSNTLPVNGLGVVTNHPSNSLCLIYTPNDDVNGTDQFTVNVCDQPTPGIDGQCIDITIHITINPVNDPPVVVEKTVDVNEKETTNISFNVTDPESDPLTFTSATSDNATSTITSNFSFDYTPNSGFLGNDEVTVKVSDSGDADLFDEGIITINVLDVLEEPVILGDDGVAGEDLNVTTNKNQYVDFCFTAKDPDAGDLISFASASQLTTDASTVEYLPGFSGSPSANRTFCFRFTPETGFVGQSEWTLTICDDSDPVTPKCGEIKVIITVNPFNYPPEVLINGSTDLTVEVPEKTTSSICVEVDDPEGDDQYVTSGLSVGNIGTISLGAAQSLCFDYTPPTDFTGEDEVEVIVCDILDNSVCTTAYITVIVFDVNEPPVPEVNSLPVETLNLTTPEDVPLLLCFDATDPEGDNISVQSVSNISGGGTLVAAEGEGFCFTFSPAANFFGTSTWDIEICDDASPSLCGTLQAIIEVTPVNDPAVLVTQEFEVNEKVTTEICIEVSDVEGNTNNLTGATSTGAIGTIANGALDDLCFDYTPPEGFIGEDEIEVTICDESDNSVCLVAPLKITVVDVNEPPVELVNGVPADTLFISTPKNIPVDFCFEVVDPEGNNVVLQSITNKEGEGSLVANNAGTFCFTFSPVTDFIGRSVWDVVICDDGVPSLCGSLIAIIDVTPENTPPTVVSKTVDVPENVTTPICIEVTDEEGNAHVFTSGSSVSSIGSVNNGVANDLCFDYTPPQDFIGEDIVEVTICDTGDASICGTGLITINVIEINSPPVGLVNGAPADTLRVSTLEDIAVNFCFEAVDPDGDQISLNRLDNISGGGALSRSGADTFCFDYIPSTDYNGTAYWEIEICDDRNPTLCGKLVIEISIAPVNDVPLANRDTLRVLRNQDFSINILDNDIDVEGDDILLSTTPVIGPGNGSLTMFQDGSVSYRSNPTFMGIDSLVYQISDTAEPNNFSQGVAVFIVEDLPFTVYEAVSPNGDGINDYWRIEGIDFYINNQVRIFDRFNNIVFETTSYDNSERVWTGQSNKGLGGDKLADGTYFYVISLGQSGKTYSGFVVLKNN